MLYLNTDLKDRCNISSEVKDIKSKLNKYEDDLSLYPSISNIKS
jgi:hypothetical protein